MEGGIPTSIKYSPIRYVQVYLWVTFIVFLFSDYANKQENLLVLIAFIAFAYGMLWLGYVIGVMSSKNSAFRPPLVTRNRLFIIKGLIFIGSIYYFVWGVNQIIDFGGNSLGDVFENITNPGESYKAKFEVYEERETFRVVNRLTQLLILCSFIYAVYVPLLVFYWKILSRRMRFFAAFSVAIYVISFLFIGTQKGLGDVVLFLLAGTSVMLGTRTTITDRRFKRRLLISFTLLLVLGFFYMALNQSSRAIEFGITQSRMFGDTSDSLLADVFGERLAYGIFAVIGYPSHGYAGLAHNLGQEFVFSYGAGLSQAFESYRHQYLGGESNFLLTYPVRTEAITGWPAGMYWSTIFPWLASDLTFPGAILFMFLAGFVVARTWLRCLATQDILSFALLGQLYIFLAFVPANNQVLMSRQGLWVLLSLTVFSTVRALFRRAGIIKTRLREDEFVRVTLTGGP